MARPKKQIDAGKVQMLASFHCTNEEIAKFFDCSTDTIERRFAGELAKGRVDGRIRLRRLQWQSAQKGNVTMQIWLGKQYLGQSDQPQSIDDSPDVYDMPESMKDD
jgi:hypothetical protein